MTICASGRGSRKLISSLTGGIAVGSCQIWHITIVMFAIVVTPHFQHAANRWSTLLNSRDKFVQFAAPSPGTTLAKERSVHEKAPSRIPAAPLRQGNRRSHRRQARADRRDFLRLLRRPRGAHRSRQRRRSAAQALLCPPNAFHIRELPC